MITENILIADAGSTKIDWCFLSPSPRPPFRFQTSGLNPLIVNQDTMKKEFEAVKEQLGYERQPKRIFYYGAGCSTPLICDKLKNTMANVFPDATIEVDSDMVAAARSLFGKGKGVACILGTGSNSALYDGEKIIKKVPSLGYILGDEGSGTALGRRLINEIYKGEMDEHLRSLFIEECNLTIPEILNRVYRQPLPNKFLASLVPFIRKQVDAPFIKNIVIEEFRRFFKRNVKHYSNGDSLPVAFTGSIAFHFEPQLREAARLEGFEITEISAAPMEGLIAFHSS